MSTIMHRAGAFLAVIMLAIAMVVAAVGESEATNAGTRSGDASTPCRLDWTAATVNNRALDDDDVITWNGTEYTHLLTTLEGGQTDYSNGGFLTEIGAALGTRGGWMELQHWYGGDKADGYTDVFWRLPVATATGFTNGGLTVTLPAGTVLPTGATAGAAVSDVTYWFKRLADAPGSTWPPTYTHGYDWNVAAPSAWAANGGAPKVSSTTVLPDGRVEVTLPLGTMPANGGIGIALAARVPTPNSRQNDQIGVARVLGTIPSGTGTCPATTSGDASQACTLDWHGDATIDVNGRFAVPDVRRAQAVTPELGSPGKFGVDGWLSASGASPAGPGTATAFGRFILAADHPFTDGTWVLHVDPRLVNPTFTISNPAMTWRVDGHYPEPVTIDQGVWDADAHTMTYSVSGDAKSSVIVSFAGDVSGSFAAGADYAFSTDLDATWVPDAANPECPVAPALALDKFVRDTDAPRGVVTEGEELTYTFVVTNTGNVAVQDIKIVDSVVSDAPIPCAPSLAVGAKAHCTATYTATPENVAAGGVSNTARAVGGVPGSTVISDPATAVIPAGSVVTETEMVTETESVTSTATETSTATATSTATETSTATATSTATVTETSTSVVPSTEVETSTVTATETLTETETSVTLSTSVVPSTATSTATMPVTVTVTETGVPTTLTDTVTVTQVPPQVTVTETSTRTVQVGATTDATTPTVTITTSACDCGTGSLDGGSLGTGSLDGSSVDTGSLEGLVGSSGGSSAGSLALGSLGLGVLAVGGLVHAINTGLIPLPPGIHLPVIALPGPLTGSLAGFGLPAGTTTTPPPAPGPESPNGRG